MEYLLELLRARGYSMLYPHFDSDDAIVTIHNELYQPPEEFGPRSSSSSSSYSTTTTTASEDPTTDDEVLAADPSIAPPNNPEPPLLTTSLLSLLPAEGDLPELTTIPLLSHAGETITSADATTLATFFAGRFKSEVGGCTGAVAKTRRPLSASDLFCLEGDEDEEGDVDEVVVDEVEPEQRRNIDGSGSSTKTSLSASTTTGARTVSVLGEGAMGTAPVVVQGVVSLQL